MSVCLCLCMCVCMCPIDVLKTDISLCVRSCDTCRNVISVEHSHVLDPATSQ